MGTEVRPLKAITIKTEEECVERFGKLREAVGASTSGQLFEMLLDRFELPQRVEDRTAALEADLAEAKREKEALEARMAEALARADEMEARSRENAELASAQQLAFEKQLSERVKLEGGQVVIDLLPENLKVLDYVCARESRRRKQEWTRSHVVNYFINARFVRGLLNGDLGSVSDSELRRLGVGRAVEL